MLARQLAKRVVDGRNVASTPTLIYFLTKRPASISTMFVRKSLCRTSALIASGTSRYVKIARSLSSYPSHEVVAMPALSPTMEAGTIAKWLVKVGDSITPGTALAEIETDKATMAFEAQDEFYIAKLLVEAGSEVRVGQPIFVSVESESSVGTFSDFKVSESAAASTPAPAATTPKPAEVPTPPLAPRLATAPQAAPVQQAAPAKPAATPATTPAPAAKAPAAAPSQGATAPSSGFYGARWGQGVKKSALLGKLSAQQAKYIELYGRSAQKPL
jgi:pyruvate dehydrogenase E2 component (dihydrolipoamide acetyltransferase)